MELSNLRAMVFGFLRANAKLNPRTGVALGTRQSRGLNSDQENQIAMSLGVLARVCRKEILIVITKNNHSIYCVYQYIFVA